MKLRINRYQIALLLLLGFETMSKACEACELQQPAITRGLTHGTGPQSQFDWIWVVLSAIITVYTLIYSFKYLIKPGEKEKSHIKNNVLNY